MQRLDRGRGRSVRGRLWRIGLVLAMVFGAVLAPAVARERERSGGVAEPRVVGGTPVAEGAYPWVAYVVIRSRGGASVCAGSLIAEDKVLTAAHCVSNGRRRIGPGAFTVVLGRANLAARSLGVARRVSAVVRHPDYRGAGGNAFDVAVLTLTEPVTTIAPVALPAADAGPDAAGQLAVVAGWGTTREGGRATERMREATLNVVGLEQCKKELGRSGRSLGSPHLCAFAQGKDTCQGDSGGPIFVASDDPVLIGVTSWGIGCARRFPGIYARLADPSIAAFVAGQLTP